MTRSERRALSAYAGFTQDSLPSALSIQATDSSSMARTSRCNLPKPSRQGCAHVGRVCRECDLRDQVWRVPADLHTRAKPAKQAAALDFSPRQSSDSQQLQTAVVLKSLHTSSASMHAAIDDHSCCAASAATKSREWPAGLVRPVSLSRVANMLTSQPASAASAARMQAFRSA